MFEFVITSKQEEYLKLGSKRYIQHLAWAITRSCMRAVHKQSAFSLCCFCAWWTQQFFPNQLTCIFIKRNTLVYSNLIGVVRISFVEAVTDGLGMWTNMCNGGWQLMPSGEGEWSIDAFAHVHTSQINLHFQQRLDKLWFI